MTEFETIDRGLINIKGQIEKLFDYKTYLYKDPSARIDQFRLNIEEFLGALQKELNSFDRLPYLLEQSSIFMDAIESKYSTIDHSGTSKAFQNSRKVALQSIKNIFNSLAADLSKEIADANNLAEVKNEDVALNSHQVSLLILYLRDTKIISDKISDSKVSEFFSLMTDYSSDQIRKSISGTNKIERNQITHLEANYNELKAILSKVIELIEADKRKAILKKAK